MATPTYTVEPEAQTADNPQSPFDWDVPDLSLNGNNAATFGGMQNCQRQGDLILCRGMDGGLHWFRYDAERSTQANPVIVFVGP